MSPIYPGVMHGHGSIEIEVVYLRCRRGWWPGEPWRRGLLPLLTTANRNWRELA